MIFWMAIFAVSTAVLAICAGGRATYPELGGVHMAVSALVSLAMAIVVIRDIRAHVADMAHPATIASRSASGMGMVWGWAALGLVVTYSTGILTWKEWWQFLLAFATVAILCFAFSALLLRSARTDADSTTLLKLGRILAWVQLVGMFIVMIGLILDGKIVRFLAPRPGWEDWAANNFFFFGAAALAAISIAAIRTPITVRHAAERE